MPFTRGVRGRGTGPPAPVTSPSALRQSPRRAHPSPRAAPSDEEGVGGRARKTTETQDVIAEEDHTAAQTFEQAQAQLLEAVGGAEDSVEPEETAVEPVAATDIQGDDDEDDAGDDEGPPLLQAEEAVPHEEVMMAEMRHIEQENYRASMGALTGMDMDYGPDDEMVIIGEGGQPISTMGMDGFVMGPEDQLAAGDQVRYEYVDEYGRVVATSTDGTNFVPTTPADAAALQQLQQNAQPLNAHEDGVGLEHQGSPVVGAGHANAQMSAAASTSQQGASAATPGPPGEGADLRTVEFNFLDNKNICCGLCGEIVPYDSLMNEHLPQNHPEVLGDGEMTMEEIPYEEWLREKLRAEKRAIESGFKLTSYEAPARVHRTVTNRVHRRISSIRVNPNEMSLAQLNAALKKKMIEKMGRKVPVTLVDKQHARCGLCNAVVSLNKKFEVVHLVRHFNAWHPSAHRCSGAWAKTPATQTPAADGQLPTKPLSMHDFAVIDTNNTTPDNLQCIWCGMFMDNDSLAMHFDEVHPNDIEVPKCNLCLQELILNARMQEKYGEDFDIMLPDEHHIKCGRYNAVFGTQGALERGIERRLARGDEEEGGDDEEDSAIGAGAIGADDADEGADGAADATEGGPEQYLNSRMSLGKRKRPKRQFIMPALRQAAPMDSHFVEPVTECHWKCKICNDDILAAVISAGAIKHYRLTHPEHLENMQYELCKARLERVSDGCMEFIHPQLIECLLCNMTYNLHRPFNMCRAIRHLKSKHPNLMPEYANIASASATVTAGPRQKESSSGGGGGGGPIGRRATSGGIGRRRRAAKAAKMANLEDEDEDEEDDDDDMMDEEADDEDDSQQTMADEGNTTEMEIRTVDSLEQLKETYGIDVSRMQTLTAEDGEQVYVLMPEGQHMDAGTAEKVVAALSGGTTVEMQTAPPESSLGAPTGVPTEQQMPEPLTDE